MAPAQFDSDFTSPTVRLVALLSANQASPGYCHITIETEYGLQLKLDNGSLLRAQVSSKTALLSSPPPAQGYRYEIRQDYATSYIWYAHDWPTSPGFAEGIGNAVDYDDLEARYGTRWTNAYAAWVARFERAFEAAGCHLGAGHDADIRPDFNGDPKLVGLVPGLGAGIMPLGQRRWAVEGLLLACWLSLQPGVDQVEYHPGGAGEGVCFETVDLSMRR